MKEIEKIRKIRDEQVAKKQDSARLNFPKILEKIESQARLGFSELELNVSEINEYDKKLLEEEGFRVHLGDIPKSSYEALDFYRKFGPTKKWIIRW